MPGLVDEPDEIVEAAYAVLQGNVSEGTEGIYRAERDDEPAVYRLDPDEDWEAVAEATASADLPDDEDAILWEAGASHVEQERGHRNLHD